MTSKEIIIAHCIWSFNVGGSETMLVDIVNEQVKTFDVSLIIINNSYSQTLLDQIDPKVRIFLLNRSVGGRSLAPLWKLNWLLFRIKPSILHLHNNNLTKLVLTKIRKRMFMTIHSLNYSLNKNSDVRCFFAISDAVRENALSQGVNNVITISNGIHIEKIHQREGQALERAKGMKIVQVANLLPEIKGQDILIKAIGLLKKRGLENFHVDFIGTGKVGLHYLTDLANSENVSQQVHFLGLRNREYIYSHLKEYDLMCHPARDEGFGLTVVEGMAAKLPVLVSDSGGPYEIIERGKLGFSFKMDDVEDCANQIERIFRDYQEAQKLTEFAFLHVRKNYTISKMVCEYTKAYRKHILL